LYLSEDAPDREAAIELAKGYADSECVGQFGEVTDVEETETEWRIEFRTHTLSGTNTHRVRITESVENVVSHDRSSRFDRSRVL
jgi:hypothetical protein